MSAYLVVDTEVADPEAYEEYKAKARPLVEKYGGVYLARGGALEVFEDDRWSPSRLVVIKFPSMEQARAFYHAEEYAPVKALRRKYARCTLALVEGL